MRRAAVPVLAALGLGIGVAAHAPALAAAALVPLVVLALARPARATLLFVFGFYLNAPVLATQDIGLPPVAAATFALLLLVPVLAAVVIGRDALVMTPALALMVGWLVVLVFSSVVAGGGSGD